MRILIITGGRIDESFALSLLQKEKFDHMIVVDGALAFWDKVERNPEIQCHFDHLVGDFDTISPNILENYLDREDAVAVSLTLPLRQEPYETTILFPFFDGLIPEGWLLGVVSRNWKINQKDRFGLLLSACRDCIGDVCIRREKV